MDPISLRQTYCHIKLMAGQSITFLVMHLYSINILQLILTCRSHNKMFSMLLLHLLLPKVSAWKIEIHSHTETNLPEAITLSTLKK